MNTEETKLVENFRIALNKCFLRSEKNMGELARDIGVSIPQVAGFLEGLGVPSPILAGKIALALNCTFDQMCFSPELTAVVLRKKISSIGGIIDSKDIPTAAHPVLVDIMNIAAAELADYEITRIMLKK
jgi:transcriptional regulator with XRE-family HTH domain